MMIRPPLDTSPLVRMDGSVRYFVASKADFWWEQPMLPFDDADRTYPQGPFRDRRS